ncbi:MAG: hypothetical protein RJB58_2030 [Pseudomonadota bacterium]
MWEPMRNIKIFLATAILVALGGGAAWATPTTIVIRVLAKDAKFVGTDMGGGQITLRDAASGELLAQGLVEGATGSTPVIMKEGRAPPDIVRRKIRQIFGDTGSRPAAPDYGDRNRAEQPETVRDHRVLDPVGHTRK